ncbi:hypothetical protein [Streptomyces longispororuber]|uniref:hypothetical protein n=1 Tax=Streptomyces longispororuber TaxID=68230 RepID=UPI00210D9FB1|nr:hypothetical protein [Streptomyces longispororuber]MCQ4208734.1 hypothetical protein [Streptomyces longispororuber]
MMRTVTSRVGRRIAAAVLTALATAGVFAAVTGSITFASGDGTVVSQPCLDPKGAHCGPANGWQEEPKT